MASQNRFYQQTFLEQLPMMSEKQVVEALTPHFDLLTDSIMDPWEDLQRRRESDHAFIRLNEDEVANWITTQAAHRARGHFDGRTGFRVATLHRKCVLIFEERLAITIKKLRADGKNSGCVGRAVPDIVIHQQVVSGIARPTGVLSVSSNSPPRPQVRQARPDPEQLPHGAQQGLLGPAQDRRIGRHAPNHSGLRTPQRGN